MAKLKDSPLDSTRLGAERTDSSHLGARRGKPRSQDKLMDAAKELMLVKGTGATSVDEICRKAGVTKGCFFHYFDSKDALVKAVVRKFCRDSQAEIAGACCKSEDPLKRIDALIDFAVKASKGCIKGKGSLIGTLAQELSDTHPQIRALCAAGFDQWRMIFQKDLDDAKRKYRTSIDSQSLAEYFVALIEGSQILAKAKQDTKIIERNLEYFRKYIKSLFNKKSG